MEAGGDRLIAQKMIGRERQIGHGDGLAGAGGLGEDALALVDGEMLALGRLVDAAGLDQVELTFGGVIAVDNTASAWVISSAREATVGSTALRSSEEDTARPTSSSTFNSLIDCARSRVRSSTLDSSPA